MSLSLAGFFEVVVRQVLERGVRKVVNSRGTIVVVKPQRMNGSALLRRVFKTSRSML